MVSIWIINQCFYPDIDATAQIMTDLAEDLVKKGLDVTVITGRNRRNFLIKEVYNGIKIVRVGVFRFDKKNLLYRYLNYLSLFPFVFIRALFMRRPNYIFVGSSPPFMPLLGLLLSLFKGSKLILNIQDLYPDVAVKLGLIKIPSVIRLAERIILKLYQKADKIICIGENMYHLLLERGAASKNNGIEIIHNWADGKQLFPLDKEKNSFAKENDLVGKFIVQYSGNLGMVHEIDTLLEVARRLSDKPEIAFLFIGDGVQKNKVVDFVNRHKLKNLFVLPFQAREQLNLSLNACDIGVVSMKIGFQGTILPSKVYGIMAVGKPILAICSSACEIGRIVAENNCGEIVRPGDVNSCAQKILKLYQNEGECRLMGDRARKAFLEKYERQIATHKYFQTICKV